MGFIAKLRIVTLGTVNDLLDKTIDLNSPSVIRQYTRDLEDALDRMKNEAVVQAGNVRTLQREKVELDGNIKTTEATIQKLIAGGHEDLARPKAADLIRMRSKFADADGNIAAAVKSSHDIDVAVANLETKHAAMVDRVRELERLDRDTKSRNDAAKALTAAGRLVQGGADISVDDVESRMRASNDVAQERFSRAMSDSAVTEDPDTTAAVDDVLSEFKAKKEATAG
jgi:phage shock protein A